jgi:hypothetical protein
MCAGTEPIALPAASCEMKRPGFFSVDGTCMKAQIRSQAFASHCTPCRIIVLPMPIAFSETRRFPFNAGRTVMLFLSLLGLALGCSHPKPPPIQFEFLFPADLTPTITKQWDGAEKNVIYIKIKPWDRLFDLHLFEDLVVPAKGYPAKHFLNNRRLNADLWHWELKDGLWHFAIAQQELVDFEITGSLRPEGNQLIVDGTLTNHTADAWPDWCSGVICLRARNAAGFEDPQARHVYLHRQRDQQWVSALDIFGPFDPKHPNETKYIGGRVNIPLKGETYGPDIIKRDLAEKHQIGIETTPAYNTMGNREPALNCIHSNLNLALAAGASKPFRIVLTFKDLN